MRQRRIQMEWNAPDCHRRNRYSAGKQCGTQACLWLFRTEAGCSNCLGVLAYGPLDYAIYDCRMAPYTTDERDLAKLHMERFQELGLKGSLLLFDRRYPSASFLSYTMTAGFSFIMRIREKCNLQVDAVKTEKWVSLTHKK